MKTIAFFNNKGGVGKTSLVYHLAHMFADMGIKVTAVDLDPQANLSSMCLNEDELEAFWANGDPGTVYGALRPLLEGEGDIIKIQGETIRRGLTLAVGDLSLSKAEDELSSQWPDCLDRKPRAFRVLSAIWRVIEQVSKDSRSEIALLDVGPNLGSLNRAALISANYVVVPLAPDIYSLQGLNNLGPTLRHWREQWEERLNRNPIPSLSLPTGTMKPVGYVVMQHGLRDNRPVKAYKRWMDRIPQTYRTSVLGDNSDAGTEVVEDSHCLAMLKHYRSLMPLAMEAHKPMFHLRPADGAIGAHVAAVQKCYDDFQKLAERIASVTGLQLD
ncbi:MAG: AAA family ATPase [Planctomycetaceae bacterium]